MLKLIKSIISKLLILLGIKAKEVIATAEAQVIPLADKVEAKVEEVKKEV